MTEEPEPEFHREPTWRELTEGYIQDLEKNVKALEKRITRLERKAMRNDRRRILGISG
jgi:hypothetical protein